MENKAAVFELENVGFNYPYEEPVLRDINLKISQGEKICILGANGCGKSTLLKMLAGLQLPQKGVFKAFDREVNAKTFSDKGFMRDYHRRTGFIFQNSDAQLFCSTVREEIAFGPLQLELPKSEVMQRVGEVLEMLGITALRDKAPFKLSGGEKKKVAMASVLAMNPQVLILDEPTNGLDPRTQRWLVEMLLSLNKVGKTIITSTHNLELVHEISDRSVVFAEDHRITADSDTSAILADVELLKRVNLVDEYYHRHGDGTHAHYHIHNFSRNGH